VGVEGTGREMLGRFDLDRKVYGEGVMVRRADASEVLGWCFRRLVGYLTYCIVLIECWNPHHVVSRSFVDGNGIVYFRGGFQVLGLERDYTIEGRS
jgi:hypothetical protein